MVNLVMKLSQVILYYIYTNMYILEDNGNKNINYVNVFLSYSAQNKKVKCVLNLAFGNGGMYQKAILSV